MERFIFGSRVLDQRTEKKLGVATVDHNDVLTGLGQSYYYDTGDMINDHGITAITLTYRTEYHSDDPLELAAELELMIAEYLYENKTNIKFVLYPEFTKDFNLHWHGVIQGNKTQTARFLKQYKKKYGFYYISKLNDFDKWVEYCRKEYKEEQEEQVKHISIMKSKYLAKTIRINREKRYVKRKKDIQKLELIEADNFFDNF